MKLEYLGHACFKITLANGLVWVTDPYDGSVGLARPGVKADVTTLSHGHYDHNCLDALDALARCCPRRAHIMSAAQSSRSSSATTTTCRAQSAARTC